MQFKLLQCQGPSRRPPALHVLQQLLIMLLQLLLHLGPKRRTPAASHILLPPRSTNVCSLYMQLLLQSSDLNRLPPAQPPLLLLPQPPRLTPAASRRLLLPRSDNVCLAVNADAAAVLRP